MRAAALPRLLAAAVLFMWGGTLLSGLYMPPYFSSPVWLPAMLWAVHGLASEARPRWALALGAFVGLSFLGGHAQGFVYAVQTSALYGVFALATVAEPGRRLRVCGLAAVAGGVAFGLLLVVVCASAVLGVSNGILTY